MLFKGVATALVTPMREGKIDYDKMCELIDWQISSGVAGIVLCGTTGEAPTINDDEKYEIFSRGADCANKRVPVIAGCGTNDTAHVIKMCEYADKAGADGFLINNPYYNKSSDEGIFASYEAVDSQVNKPIIIYNVPSRTGKNIHVELALELMKLKNVDSFKEASGDISQIAELIARKPDRITVYSGNDDQIVPIMALGGMGVICTCSNIAPELLVEITQLFFDGDLEGARAKQFEFLNLFKALFCDANPIPLKTAMNMAGMDVGEMRLPLIELKGAKRDYLEKTLKDYNLLP